MLRAWSTPLTLLVSKACRLICARYSRRRPRCSPSSIESARHVCGSKQRTPFSRKPIPGLSIWCTNCGGHGSAHGPRSSIPISSNWPSRISRLRSQKAANLLSADPKPPVKPMPNARSGAPVLYPRICRTSSRSSNRQASLAPAAAGTWSGSERTAASGWI